MSVPMGEAGANRQEGPEAARAVRLALILGFSALAVAGVYFGALYLIAH